MTVVGFVVLVLTTVATLNWLVNPYGQYSPQFIAPIVQDSRSEKLGLFEQFETPPTGLVLGSSRTMKFEPSYLDERTSLSFFNFGVNHGRPEDFLAILRMYHARFGSFPKAVVIGIDVAALNDDVPNDARLSSEPRLYAYARDTQSWSEEFGRFSQLFSYQQLSASLKALRSKGTHQNESETRFDRDGVIQYLQRQSEMAAGTYDFEKALDFNQREFLSIFAQLTAPSSRRLGYLAETVKICKENDCQVYLFATVHHPKLRETIATKTKFLSVEKQAIQAIQAIADKHQITFLDFGDVESFAGDPNAFVDGIHPLESNTRRMIDRLMPQSSEANYAVQ